jgi:hypothetical protein
MKRFRAIMCVGVLGAIAPVLSACIGPSGPVGLESCKKSARGECPEIEDKTLYYRNSATIVYYAPSGKTIRLQGGGFSSATWRVDASGLNYHIREPFAGDLGAQPIASFTQDAEVYDGDPAGLQLNGRKFILQLEEKRPFAEIAAEVRAR